MFAMCRESFAAYFSAWCCVNAPMGDDSDINAFNNAVRNGIVFG